MLWPDVDKWLARVRRPVRRVPRPDPPLLIELRQLQKNLACLENQFNNVDRDMVEYVIFKLNAAECLLATLRQAARREHLTAWGETPHPVVR